MTKYVPSTVADQLSNALWDLARPEAVRAAGEVTNYLFDWITDTQGKGWLVAMDDYTIIVNPSAELGNISTILQPWITQGVLPSDTLTTLAAIIAQHAVSGEPLNVYNTFPEYFKSISKTYDEMIQEGLISTDHQTLGAPPAPRG